MKKCTDYEVESARPRGRPRLEKKTVRPDKYIKGYRKIVRSDKYVRKILWTIGNREKMLYIATKTECE